jgi:hypothetical protein
MCIVPVNTGEAVTFAETGICEKFPDVGHRMGTEGFDVLSLA